ncbi:MAG: TonB-dependent receptor [Myxococcales bacterium]|nr:TonB-dependent receptor [Myxococcales bacterium]
MPPQNKSRANPLRGQPTDDQEAKLPTQATDPSPLTRSRTGLALNPRRFMSVVPVALLMVALPALAQEPTAEPEASSVPEESAAPAPTPEAAPVEAGAAQPPTTTGSGDTQPKAGPSAGLLQLPQQAPKDWGTLHVVVFIGRRSTPALGVMARIGETRAVTNEDGAAGFSGPGGIHNLYLLVPRGLVPGAPGSSPAVEVKISEVPVVPFETTELIVTLSESGAVTNQLLEVAKKSQTSQDEEDSFEKRKATNPAGLLEGLLLSLDTKKPVARARVFVRGAPVEAESDAQGRFRIELPAGEYALSIIHTQYSTQTVDGIVVPAKGKVEVPIELSPSSVELDEFVVTAPHVEGTVASVMDERRDTSNVADVLGAEQMSAAGDSSAASALTRVTGVTLVGGKYIYIRGLGERYSSTLLNGADLPSPDPSRKVIPLDLFPTSVLGSVVVQKTYSPDMPGDFSGGVVQLRTRGVPEKFHFSLGLSTGANSVTTFQSGNTHRGGGRDWLGYDDGTRSVPGEWLRLTEGGTKTASLSHITPRSARPSAQDKVGLFEHNYSAQQVTMPLDLGVNAEIGDRLTFSNGAKVGIQLAGQYDNGWMFRGEDRGQITIDTVTGGFRRDFPTAIRQTTQDVSMASVGSVSAEFGKNHRLESTTLLTRKTAKNSSLDRSITNDSGEREKTTLSWNEQQLFAQQLRGEHEFERLARLKLSWMANYSTASRDEPDTREYSYVRDTPTAEVPNPTFRYLVASGPLRRNYETLMDESLVYGFDLKLPVSLGAKSELLLSSGGLFSRVDRDARVLRYRFVADGLSDEERALPLDQIFSPERVASGRLDIQDEFLPTDAYTAKTRTSAGYLMGEFIREKWLRFQGGVRVESALVSATTRPFVIVNPMQVPEVTGAIEQTNILPAGTLTLNTTEHSQLRIAVSQTVNRPQLRELSPAKFIDPETRIPYIGNENLRQADVTNYDARFEWYASATEMISFALFRKDFTNPIEITILPSGEPGDNNLRRFTNIPSARNYGAEMDFRYELDRNVDALEGYFLAGNLTLIRSEVEIPEADKAGSTNLRRPMQGQSPWIANLQLGYSDPEEGRFEFLVAFNMLGERIVEVGQSGIPDAYEQPVPLVDFTASYAFTERLRLKIKGRNLMDPLFQVEQAGLSQRAYRRGRSVAVSLSYEF